MKFGTDTIGLVLDVIQGLSLIQLLLLLQDDCDLNPPKKSGLPIRKKIVVYLNAQEN
jgi:hypothetical protein